MIRKVPCSLHVWVPTGPDRVKRDIRGLLGALPLLAQFDHPRWLVLYGRGRFFCYHILSVIFMNSTRCGTMQLVTAAGGSQRRSSRGRDGYGFRVPRVDA